MTLRHSTRFWLIPIGLAWIFDLLFWKRMPGLSFPLFMLLVIGSGLFLAYSQKKRPAKASLVLIPLILFFAIMFAIREEPVTTLVNISYTLGGLAILAVTLLGGQWFRYSVSDYIAKWFVLGLDALANPMRYFLSKKETGEVAEEKRTTSPHYALPILRGLLLALPVVALLAGLLASADPIFSKNLEDFLGIFRIENLGEYIFRMFYVLIFGFVLMGVYLHSLTASQEEKLIGIDKPWLSPFLGWIESVIVLGSVDLLFLFFVVIQFRYFFGGQANIHIEGFTYAEYARRGTNELLFVAFLSLLLFLGLSAITKRAEKRQRSLFTWLGILLVLLVSVILVSGYQRLLLYETVYGFSRIRTYTHVFMIWLGLLLAATIALEVIQRPRAFALAALVAALGFGLTLNLMNVDGFIARQNTARALQNQKLDYNYLVSLSSDVTPELARLYNGERLPETIKDQLGAALACRAANQQDELNYDPAWMSFHYSSYQAAQVQRQMEPVLKAVWVQTGERSVSQVKINGQEFDCQPNYEGMD